jgi:hypothetical protein
MANRNVRILNLSRSPLGIGPKNIPAAKGNPTPTVVDLMDGKTRKNLAELGDRVAILGAEAAVQTVVVPLVAVDTAGGAFSWQNPTGKRIHVQRLDLDVTTIATAAGTISVGSTPTSAVTSSANLLDTLDVHSGTGLFSSTDDTDNGTAGKAKGQMVAAGKWVNGSRASGALAGLVGNALITYVVAE